MLVSAWCPFVRWTPLDSDARGRGHHKIAYFDCDGDHCVLSTFGLRLSVCGRGGAAHAGPRLRGLAVYSLLSGCWPCAVRGWWWLLRAWRCWTLTSRARPPAAMRRQPQSGGRAGGEGAEGRRAAEQRPQGAAAEQTKRAGRAAAGWDAKRLAGPRFTSFGGQPRSGPTVIDRSEAQGAPCIGSFTPCVSMAFYLRCVRGCEGWLCPGCGRLVRAASRAATATGAAAAADWLTCL